MTTTARLDHIRRLRDGYTRHAEFARGWRASGLSMIGGCCGIGPGQIASLEKVRA